MFLLTPMAASGLMRVRTGQDTLLLWLPPVWFLGVYEVVLGTTSRTSWKLAQDAFLASALSSAVGCERDRLPVRG